MHLIGSIPEINSELPHGIVYLQTSLKKLKLHGVRKERALAKLHGVGAEIVDGCHEL